jgi:hypothetical protein
MSKIITSPVRRFPGTVTLAYPLPFPRYLAWKEAVRNFGESSIAEVALNDDNTPAVLPGICACVERWDIIESKDTPPKQYTPETFPASPRLAAGRLIIWLMQEIIKIISEEDEAPLV